MSTQTHQFSKDGVLRFEPGATAPLVADVAAQFEQAIADDQLCDDRGPTIAPHAHRYVTDVHLRIPAITRLLTPEVIAVAEAHYGCHVRVRSVRAYRNQGAPDLRVDENVHANLWHLDPELTCDLRYFVYLGETGPDDGPLEVLDRHSTAIILRTGFLDGLHVVGPARRLIAGRSTRYEGGPGTGVLIDAQHSLHRAPICSPGHHRDVVQFWLTPSPQPLAPNWSLELPPDPSFHGGRPGDG